MATGAAGIGAENRRRRDDAREAALGGARWMSFEGESGESPSGGSLHHDGITLLIPTRGP